MIEPRYATTATSCMCIALKMFWSFQPENILLSGQNCFLCSSRKKYVFFFFKIVQYNSDTRTRTNANPISMSIFEN